MNAEIAERNAIKYFRYECFGPPDVNHEENKRQDEEIERECQE